jgi:hypothetical protein
MERYLFDVRGAIVVPGVLTAAEVSRLNEALDENAARRSSVDDATYGSPALAGDPRYQYWNTMEWPKPWCEPFRSLLAHERIRPYLDDLLGRGWHVDHLPEVFEFEKGSQGHALHFGQWWIHPGVWYRVVRDQIRNGVVVVEYVLTEQHRDGGGFAFIPGSHKSNFPRPDGISRYLDHPEIVDNPAAQSGDAIVFTEGVTHGALPWRLDHARRVAIYRYAAKTVQYGPGFHNITWPAWVDELSEPERAALEPAHFYDRPVIDRAGAVQTVWDDYDDPSDVDG